MEPRPTPELAVLSGAPAGSIIPLDRDVVTIGRHADASLRFSPERDLEVSGRHAVIAPDSTGGWFVRDLGSTNGTFLNGRRINGDHSLTSGDRITFGERGPMVQFRFSGSETPFVTTISSAGVPGFAAAELAAAAAPRPPAAVQSTATPASTAKRTRAPLVLVSSVALLLIVVAGASLYVSRQRNVALEGERIMLQQRIDSLIVAGEAAAQSLQGQIQALADALRETQQEVRQASQLLERAQASGTKAEVAALQGRLDSATTALGRQQAAATLDFAGIQRSNRRAVAMIYVESQDGIVSTGTAFAVRPNATLITARHVVAGESGQERPRRVAIQFSDSEQVWPARVLAVAADADLAIVKVDNIVGDVPVVRPFNLRADTLGVGGVVATIGFPSPQNPAALEGTERARMVQPVISAGVISEIAADELEIQGYGSAGASGSPIFDANGSVIAVLFGGLLDTAYPTLVGVPASAAVALLRTSPE